MLRNGRYISIASRTIWIGFLFSLAALTCAHIHASSFYRIKLRWCEKSKIRWMHRRKQGAIILDSRFLCRRRAVRTKNGEYRGIYPEYPKVVHQGYHVWKNSIWKMCKNVLASTTINEAGLSALHAAPTLGSMQCCAKMSGIPFESSFKIEKMRWQKKLKQDCCNYFNICWLRQEWTTFYFIHSGWGQ